uniref:Uncharacterized protein n=1 Tax=Molossus molossus TaxID=27622 RepID=A0A7J8B846_MOLMO|nr:hypothetical protein HJG59_010479 [Molossus molossus]
MKHLLQACGGDGEGPGLPPGGGVLLVTSPQWKAMSCSSLASFQPGSRENQGSINVFGVNVHCQRMCLWVSEPCLSGSVCLLVGPGLGDQTMTASHRREVWSKNQPRKCAGGEGLGRLPTKGVPGCSVSAPPPGMHPWRGNGPWV